MNGLAVELKEIRMREIEGSKREKGGIVVIRLENMEKKRKI